MHEAQEEDQVRDCAQPYAGAENYPFGEEPVVAPIRQRPAENVAQEREQPNGAIMREKEDGAQLKVQAPDQFGYELNVLTSAITHVRPRIARSANTPGTQACRRKTHRPPCELLGNWENRSRRRP